MTNYVSVTGRGYLALAPFEQNKTFLGGDVTRFITINKPRVAHLLELLLELYVKGDIKSITPVTTFDAIKVEEAFKYRQKGTHMGKMVINFPSPRPFHDQHSTVTPRICCLVALEVSGRRSPAG
jgi:hypothetical protein